MLNQKKQQSCFCSPFCLLTLVEVRTNKDRRLLAFRFTKHLLVFQESADSIQDLLLAHHSQLLHYFAEEILPQGSLLPDILDISITDPMSLLQSQFYGYIGRGFSLTTDVKSLPGSQIADCQIEGRVFLPHLSHC